MLRRGRSKTRRSRSSGFSDLPAQQNVQGKRTFSADALPFYPVGQQSMQQTLTPTAEPASVLVFCGDHGCKKADPALSPFTGEVTQAIFRSLAAGISGTGVLARAAGAALTVVDVGIDGDVAQVQASAAEIMVCHSKVRRGTADLKESPAMDETTLAAAMAVGQQTVAAESARGVRVVCIGEVGIGNTTSSAALVAALTGSDAADCCGRGTGLDDGGLAHKTLTVKKALTVHQHAVAKAAEQLGGEETRLQAREALRCMESRYSGQLPTTALRNTSLSG